MEFICRVEGEEGEVAVKIGRDFLRAGSEKEGEEVGLGGGGDKTTWRRIMRKRGEIHSRVKSRNIRVRKGWLNVQGMSNDRIVRERNNLSHWRGGILRRK